MAKTTEGTIYVLTNPVMPNLVMIGKALEVEKKPVFRDDMPKLKKHIQNLYSSSAHSDSEDPKFPVPVPFEVYYACNVSDVYAVIGKVQEKFKKDKINSDRGFFRVNPERVFLFLKNSTTTKKYIIQDVTPHDDCVVNDKEHKEQKILNNARDMRPVFKFSSLGIPIGSTLTFIRERMPGETITVRVADDDLNVHFRGEITSLSDAALRVLNHEFRRTWVTTWSLPVHGEPRPWGPLPTGPSPWGPNYWVYEKESLSERRLRMEFDSIVF